MKIVRVEKGSIFWSLVSLPAIAIIYGIIGEWQSIVVTGSFDLTLAFVHLLLVGVLSLPLILIGYKIEK